MSRADTARALLAIPLFDDLLTDLERNAVNAAVNAQYDNHEARQAFLAEVRAIRNLRTNIEVISKEDQPIVRKPAPA